MLKVISPSCDSQFPKAFPALIPALSIQGHVFIKNLSRKLDIRNHGLPFHATNVIVHCFYIPPTLKIFIAQRITPYFFCIFYR